MMWDYWGWGWGMGLMMVLFWVPIIILLVWLFRRPFEGGSYRPGGRDPLDIAKERYARGEITREQFEQIKNDLK